MESNQITVGEVEPIQLPLKALRTALTCAGDASGVYVHKVGNDYRVAATDGHRLLVYSVKAPRKTPAWVKSGVLIPADGLKERLALLDKVSGKPVDLVDGNKALIAYAENAPYILIQDLIGSCLFRMPVAEITFAPYQAVIDRLKLFEERTVADMESTAYDAGHLREAGVMAKMLGSKSVRVFNNMNPGDPSLVLFPDNPNVMLVLQPMRAVAKAIGAGAGQVLSAAVAGTVSALRAHQTRWKQRGGKAADQKVAEYEARIAAIIAAANPGPALPAPEPQPEPELVEPEPVVVSEPEMPEPEPVVVTEPEHADLATFRRGLSKAKQAKDRTRFVADVNAALSKGAGVTVHQLADGVPIDDWYLAGVPAEDAAERCLDWRRIGSVLPPDEIAEGEADLPVGLLKSKAALEARKNGKAATEAEPEPEPEPAPAMAEAAPAEVKRGGKRGGGRRQQATGLIDKIQADAKFEAFCAEVDKIIQQRQGVSLDDLVDVPLRDWYDNKNSPRTAANKAIRFHEHS